jgi:hypothetical protein
MMNNDDDYLDENERHRELEFIRQVDSNDPCLLRVKIGDEIIDGHIPHDGNWGEFSGCFGRNTYIEEVWMSIDQEDLYSFAPGFASNKSIKSLTIYCAALGNGKALGALLPFFMNNPAFKSLSVKFANPMCVP